MNGEDSLGLSYEKEIRTNGTVQNKHYVSAGGVVFAMSTKRTGTLNGLPANDRDYFNQDHLGSIAAITNSSGVVTERLAYDPWGKRRFIRTHRDYRTTWMPSWESRRTAAIPSMNTWMRWASST